MINLSKKIEDDILEYCKLNEITDINNFIEKILRNGLNIEKYGNKPEDSHPSCKEVSSIQ